MTGGTIIRSLFFAGTIAAVRSLEPCPKFCVCDTWYDLQRASCTGRHLYSIHTGAPDTVQALDLSNNSISSLNNFELANAGLTRLMYLNLSGNSISEIGLSAFDRLPDLMVLDLSRNHLYYILPDVFVESRSLQILRLSKNNFNAHVPKLRSPWLTELSVDSCQISHLPLDTFNGLLHIRNLDLSNNLMIQLDSVALHKLHFLKKLSLDGNPWSCNKVMYDLQLHLRRAGVEFNTVCGKVPAPKQFEKMILQPIKKVETHRRPIHKESKIEKIVPKKNVSVFHGERNLCLKTINDISAYWFLAAGFILGSACTMFASYIWLKGTLSCCRRCSTLEQTNDDTQRLSLLSNLWHFEDMVLGNNGDLVASCPGTPPPPYRDVMLRPGLYRCPPNATNLNDNDAGCSERYT